MLAVITAVLGNEKRVAGNRIQIRQDGRTMQHAYLWRSAKVHPPVVPVTPSTGIAPSE